MRKKEVNVFSLDLRKKINEVKKMLSKTAGDNTPSLLIDKEELLTLLIVLEEARHQPHNFESFLDCQSHSCNCNAWFAPLYIKVKAAWEFYSGI